MSRTSLSQRCATREDAPLLVELWSDALRRADRSEQVADMELVIKDAAASPESRLVIVECGGAVAGAVLLRVTTISPLNPEATVQAIHPRVFDDFRRHGVGHALMDATATFAEECGVLHVATAISGTSRDANRFMARLGLGPVAVYRSATTSVLRSRVSPERASYGVDGGRSRVLAARRSMRRSRAGVQPMPESPFGPA